MTEEKKIGEFEFKAEMKQLLDLIIHSLYTNQEIFLRELISNSSDALNKIRFRRLTDSSIIDPEAELRINISVDEENNTISIEDSGLGMTHEDLINRLGTVASSGTLEFLKEIKDNKKTLDGSMIGQFGVGFYSVFMVTDEVTVETRSADADSEAWVWKSGGDDKFSVEKTDKETRGTKISFKFKEENKDLCTPDKIKNLLKKYSNFVDFPIFVNDEAVERVAALWHKKKDETKEEELNEFYKFISNDFMDPLGHIHVSIEGTVNFKALLFIPKSAPPAMFTQNVDKSLHLYSSKIFIQDDCQELLPDYLSFVKGIVDTEDLPLNVSREVTQNSPLLTKIKNVVTSKLLALFEDWAENDVEKFNTVLKEFGPIFKSGVNSDFANRDKIIDLLRFETSAKEKGELVSLKDYVSRMGEEQKEIYYISGEHRNLIEKNPNLEYFKNKDIEIIYLIDPVDIFTFPYIKEYDSKPLTAVEKADIKNDDKDSKDDALDKDATRFTLEAFKKVLGDKVEDVIESNRLVDSPVTLVIGKEGMDAQMEKMMSIMDKNFKGSKRILEINTSHTLIKNLSRINMDNSDDAVFENSVNQLFEGALLIEGQMKSPADFVKRMNDFMLKATEK
ncbi:MAG: molecular chaperone HtpG [Candidatus Kapabacteria bacterium]|jgi:molecular chaperone HtpG|nr:molecular chaperone HtpG [Candidatus Kapabacteria bacterium]